MKIKSLKHRDKDKIPKKKFNIISKITYSFLVIMVISLFYFVILVSIKPKSIPYITNLVEKNLKEKFSDNIKVEEILFSFTRYGTIKLFSNNVKINYSISKSQARANDINTQQVLILPKIEAEFSIYKIFFLQFQPKKIRIIDSEIKFNLDFLNTENVEQNKLNLTNDVDQFSTLNQIIAMIKKGEIPIERFEVQNAKLILTKDGLSNEFLIKLAKIKIDQALDNNSVIELQGLLAINKSSDEITLKSQCLLKQDDQLKCDINFNNFSPNILAKFNSKLIDLDKISSKFDGNIKLKIENKKLKNFEFILTSNSGSFLMPKYFSQKIDFKDLKIIGNYNDEISLLNLNEIEADFISPDNLKQGYNNPHISMSIAISDLKNDSLKMDFYIRLQNILQNQMANFWPLNLNQNDIRKWVINHMSNGIIKNAFTKFSLTLDPNHVELIDIDSEIVFSEMDLSYDQYFPSINDLSGIARFSKNNMEIKLLKGNLLNSSIKNAEILIKNFQDPNLILSINGEIEGDASDGLRHVNYLDNDYKKQLEKYLNGQANTKFSLAIPLSQPIDLSAIEIDVNSAISSLKNNYLAGDVIIKTFKPQNSLIFNNQIDLTNSKLTINDFDLTKDQAIQSELTFNLLVNQNQNILIKDINLNKIQQYSTNNVNNQKLSKIDGEIDLSYNPMVINSLKVNNRNFGNNNFSLSYRFDQNKKSKKIIVKGSKFFAGNILKSNILNSSDSRYANDSPLKNLSINVNLNRIELINKKFIRNLNIFANCNYGVCSSLSINGDYGKLQIINVQANKKPDENIALIDGRITDLGYLAEGLGISNIISEGNTKINLKQKNINNKNIVEGLILIDDDIVIFEDEKVKKLSKDTLYSQIKDSIFSSNKTTFDRVKIDFILTNKILKINSLIANNLKIGITAKGEINLANNDIQLKGMIIPGYIVNNLFGIGKIPLIGSVISGVLTGGEGGGVFGLKYQYIKKPNQEEGEFSTNKVSAFVPSTIQNLFD